MGLHMGDPREMALGSHQPPIHRPPLGVSLLCHPTGSPWSSPLALGFSLSSHLLPNLPVPQLLMDKQPLQAGETEAGRNQTRPRLLFPTKLAREARSPGSCAHFHPKLICKVIFPLCQ